MNTTTLSLPAKFPPEAGPRRAWSWSQRLVRFGQGSLRFIADHIVMPIFTMIRSAARGAGLIIITGLAIGDGLGTPLIAALTNRKRPRARASWLHRWSRAARFVLGLRTTVRGHAPVSGIIVANYTSLLDTLVLAAIHPCVFVAGAELHRRPLVGLLARLGGTIVVRSSRRVDLQLATFAIERAVQRRQIVVIFPECNPYRGFTTALFQPASELGCTLTATAIGYAASCENARSTTSAPRWRGGLLAHLSQVVTRRHSPVTVAFDGPRFHRGHRKLLAHQLRGELLALDPTITR